MDVVLGVAVTGRVARLAMVGSSASGGQVFDQYALDLPDGGMTDLAETIVGTYREVAESGNRVAAIRLVVPDPSQAETLRQSVVGAGVPNVDVVAETEAAAALARSVGADAALLLSDDDTVSLTRVGDDEDSTSVLASLPIGLSGAAVASAAVLQSVPSGETVRIVLVGQRLDLESIAAELHTTVPVEVPQDAGYAIARGAAQTASDSGLPAGAATMMAPAAVEATQMAPAVGDATQMAPAVGDATQMAPVAGEATQMAPATDSAAVGPQLAYSEEGPAEYEVPFEQMEEFVPELEDEQAYTAMIAPPPPKTVLMGSAFAFVVVAFATLAASVAITIRPVADVQAQPAPPVQPQTVPGRFLPEVPHQPDPVALPIAVVSPAPSAPAVRVPVNRVPVAPAPQVPVQIPAPVPGAPVVPAVPVPGVPIVPFNPFNPFPTIPTWTTTVTTSVTPTTTTSPTTTSPTTTSPTTTTETTTETTTSEETSTPTTVPTVPPEPEPPTSQAPEPEIEYSPPSVAPEPEYSPPAVAPEPVAPEPVAPEPVAPEPVAPAEPELPSSGGGSYDEPTLTFPESP
ncbi:hypothetical protein [Mycolicibacterium arseniciresistens]|uniref:DUF7159 domain-containing protein n=1 Tax=Mycolicibacterium arseniciresistens TaxID=3062257 RepID=A0ABT8U9K7_9MYCO|nr:hypothetical protein [Mycolicibacterium arseniciresistens]MDO3634472.1 hypothetical protein [Mycolicibacterium arseniciresistens]